MASRGRGGGRRGGAQQGQPSQIEQLTLDARLSDPTLVETFSRDEVSLSIAGPRMSRKKGRGKTRGIALEKRRREGEKLAVDIPLDVMRAVGNNAQALIIELGIIVRQMAPLRFPKWKAIPDDDKNKMWHAIKHMDEERILNVVSLDKDVDGFHPLNMGNLAMRGREPLFVPCTPKGCIELLLRYGVEIMGKKAVVIGRSNIVGMPTSLLLQRHHATVSTVHAFTRNPKEITREADIVVSAIGVANIVRGDWLKPGAVVLDVGINPVEDPSNEYGYRLIGDVCFEEAVQVASAITPVPGGVGPMTIAMLLSNTLDSSKRAYGFS